MDRAHRRLLVLQSVLAIGNSMAASFALVFLLDPSVTQPPFTARDIALLNLVSFAISALGCVAFTRLRPRRARASMAAGLAALVVSYLAYLALRGWPLLLVVAVAWGVYIPLFFLPFNSLVVRATKAKDRAGTIGTFILVYALVAIAGPSVGGLIIHNLGYSVLFSIAGAVLLVNVGLVFGLRQGPEPIPFAFDFKGLGPRTTVALFAEGGFEGIAFAIIPVIAYGFTESPVDLGGLFSLFALAGGVVTVVLGVWSDRLLVRRSFLAVGAGLSIVWTLLVVRASSVTEFALGNSLLSLTSSVAPLFLYTIAVDRLAGRPAQAVATREVLLNAGRAASLLVFFVLTAYGVPAQLAFALAAVSLAFVALGQDRPSDVPQ
ncbi:MAG: MFS transporter [Methanobacteriota archaeon]|nr:MAG: MFS transporter [Euryarchaeota archaeon]